MNKEDLKIGDWYKMSNVESLSRSVRKESEKIQYKEYRSNDEKYIFECSIGRRFELNRIHVEILIQEIGDNRKDKILEGGKTYAELIINDLERKFLQEEWNKINFYEIIPKEYITPLDQEVVISLFEKASIPPILTVTPSIGMLSQKFSVYEGYDYEKYHNDAYPDLKLLKFESCIILPSGQVYISELAFDHLNFLRSKLFED